MEGVSLQAVTLADGSTAYIQHNSKGTCHIHSPLVSTSNASPQSWSSQQLHPFPTRPKVAVLHMVVFSSFRVTYICFDNLGTPFEIFGIYSGVSKLVGKWGSVPNLFLVRPFLLFYFKLLCHVFTKRAWKYRRLVLLI